MKNLVIFLLVCAGIAIAGFATYKMAYKPNQEAQTFKVNNQDVNNPGEWKLSKLFAATPDIDENGKLKGWKYWQLEYNTETFLLRPANIIKGEIDEPENSEN